MGRRGHQIIRGIAGICQDFGFYSEETLQDLEQRSSCFVLKGSYSLLDYDKIWWPWRAEVGAGGAIQVQRTVVARTLEVAMDRAPGMKFLMGEVTPVRLLIIQQAPWDCR